jgi:hypothetical protein
MTFKSLEALRISDNNGKHMVSYNSTKFRAWIMIWTQFCILSGSAVDRSGNKKLKTH